MGLRVDVKPCIEALIDAVRDRPVIYDLTDPHHKDQRQLMQSWNEVMDLIQVFPEEVRVKARLLTVKDVKDKFYGLRSTWQKEKRKLASSGGGPEAENRITWPWFDQLRFLECNSAQLEVDTDGWNNVEVPGYSNERPVDAPVGYVDDPLENHNNLDFPNDNSNISSSAIGTPSNSPLPSRALKRRGSADNGILNKKQARLENHCEVILEVAEAVKASANQTLPKDKDRTFVEYLYQHMKEIPADKKDTLHMDMLSLVMSAKSKD